MQTLYNWKVVHTTENFDEWGVIPMKEYCTKMHKALCGNPIHMYIANGLRSLLPVRFWILVCFTADDIYVFLPLIGPGIALIVLRNWPGNVMYTTGNTCIYTCHNYTWLDLHFLEEINTTHLLN